MSVFAELFPKQTPLKFSEICAPDTILQPAWYYRLDFGQS